MGEAGKLTSGEIQPPMGFMGISKGPGDATEMPRRCQGDAKEMIRKYFGDATGMQRRCPREPRHPKEMPRKCQPHEERRVVQLDCPDRRSCKEKQITW